MPKSVELLLAARPAAMADEAKVTASDVNRFLHAVDVKDIDGFVAALQEFMHERLAGPAAWPRTSAGGTQQTTTSTDDRASPRDARSIELQLARQAAALRADTRWEPSATEIQRGRKAQLDAFDRPGNLPLVRYAELAGKSRQQVYKDIAAV